MGDGGGGGGDGGGFGGGYGDPGFGYGDAPGGMDAGYGIGAMGGEYGGVAPGIGGGDPGGGYGGGPGGDPYAAGGALANRVSPQSFAQPTPAPPTGPQYNHPTFGPVTNQAPAVERNPLLTMTRSPLGMTSTEWSTLLQQVYKGKF